MWPHFREPCTASGADRQQTTKQITFLIRRKNIMAFFTSAVGVLQTLVVALGAGLGIWAL
jgi:hypothetical protein